MDAADELPLPFPFTSSSSNTDSKPRPVHASDCSQRPRKSIMKLEEGWWGSASTGSAQLTIEEDSREMDKRIKMRRLSATAPASQDYWEEESCGGPRNEEDSVMCEPDDVSISSNSRNVSRRHPSPPAFSDLKPSRGYSHSLRPNIRKKKRSTRARQSHPWLSSRPALPPLRRSPTPPIIPLRSANDMLGTPIAVLQEQNQHTFNDYEPFLTQQAIEPMFSVSFYRHQIGFFTSISSPVNWSNRSSSKIFKTPSWPTLSEKVMNLAPNFQLIRRDYPPRRSNTELTEPHRAGTQWEGIYKVLEWIYGRKLCFDEQLWFIENVPLPLLALVKIHSSNRDYARGIWSVATQFEAYLDQRPSTQFTAFELCAKYLFDWLRKGAGKRSARWRNWWRDEVQREREGKVAKGMQWIKELDGMKTMRDLEGWEEDMKAAKRWDYGRLPW